MPIINITYDEKWPVYEFNEEPSNKYDLSAEVTDSELESIKKALKNFNEMQNFLIEKVPQNRRV